MLLKFYFQASTKAESINSSFEYCITCLNSLPIDVGFSKALQTSRRQSTASIPRSVLTARWMWVLLKGCQFASVFNGQIKQQTDRLSFPLCWQISRKQWPTCPTQWNYKGEKKRADGKIVTNVFYLFFWDTSSFLSSLNECWIGFHGTNNRYREGR